MLTKSTAKQILKRVGLQLSESHDIFLGAFEAGTRAGAEKLISTNKLLTSLLLLIRGGRPDDKIDHLYGIYAENQNFIRSKNVQIMIDHIFFCVEEAIMHLVPFNHPRYARMISIKCQMHRNVRLFNYLNSHI